MMSTAAASLIRHHRRLWSSAERFWRSSLSVRSHQASPTIGGDERRILSPTLSSPTAPKSKAYSTTAMLESEILLPGSHHPDDVFIPHPIAKLPDGKYNTILVTYNGGFRDGLLEDEIGLAAIAWSLDLEPLLSLGIKARGRCYNPIVSKLKASYLGLRGIRNYVPHENVILIGNDSATHDIFTSGDVKRSHDMPLVQMAIDEANLSKNVYLAWGGSERVEDISLRSEKGENRTMVNAAELYCRMARKKEVDWRPGEKWRVVIWQEYGEKAPDPIAMKLKTDKENILKRLGRLEEDKLDESPELTRLFKGVVRHKPDEKP